MGAAGIFKRGMVSGGLFNLGLFPAKNFYQLLAASQIVGGTRPQDAPLTNTRAGARGSVYTESDVAANEVDAYLAGGIPFVSSMNGATNLVSTVLTDVEWVKFSNKVQVTASDYRYTISFDGTGVTNVANGIPLFSVNRVCAFRIRLLSGSFVGAVTSDYIGFRVGGIQKGTPFELATLTTSWQYATSFVTSADATDNIVIRSTNGTPAVIEIECVRVVDSLIPHAAFPIGSAAGATYPTDLLSATGVTHASIGNAVIPFMPYAWSGTGNPANATPIIYEAGAFQVTLEASGFYTTNGGAVSTKKPVANTLSVIIVKWDGVNHTISVDDETPVSNLSAIVPSGTVYEGNLAAGTEPSHASEAILIGSGYLTAGDITTWNSGLQNLFGSIVLR